MLDDFVLGFVYLLVGWCECVVECYVGIYVKGDVDVYDKLVVCLVCLLLVYW